jgi:hypothetical protein
MKAAQKFIHPILGIRELRLSEKSARGYGWAPYEEPKVIVTDDDPAKYSNDFNSVYNLTASTTEMYPTPTAPQAPELPKPTEPTPAPVTTQKAKPGRKPKAESAPKKQTRKPKAE